MPRGQVESIAVEFRASGDFACQGKSKCDSPGAGWLSLDRRARGRYIKPHIPPVASAAGREAALWAASACLEARIKTNVYIDGFNFYYGALRTTPYRWVKVRKFCELLLPKNTIAEIKYFTALVSARPNDPDQTVRQQLFLRSLQTLPGVSIHLGHFLSHEVTMPLVVTPGQRRQYVRVLKTEEKGSDVNLATHLLHDAHMGRFDIAVVVSNNSDLLEPIKIVREQLGKKVGILNPHKIPAVRCCRISTSSSRYARECFKHRSFRRRSRISMDIHQADSLVNVRSGRGRPCCAAGRSDSR